MGYHKGRVTEIRFDPSGKMEAFIACPAEAVPLIGQYLLAHDPDDSTTALGTAVFITQRLRQGFWAAPPIPPAWVPGTKLELAGPLGHGFDLRGNWQRLALVGLGDTVARLMPLVRESVPSQSAMTLFTDLPLPQTPASLEVYPLNSLVESLDWPDFMLIDLSLEQVPRLRQVLKLPEGAILPCPAQVLVTVPMPCAGMARCGACALPARRGWKLVCEDGPVFDLRQLKW